MITNTLNAEVTIAQLKAALLFVPKGDIRGYLNGVCVEHNANGARMIATDGHRMLVMKLNTDQDIEPQTPTVVRYVISRAMADMSAKANSKRGSVALVWEQTNSPDPERPGVIIVGNAVIHIAGIPTTDVQDKSGKFPDYERLVPSAVSGDMAHYNSAYLHDCTKAMHLLARRPAAAIGSAFIAHNGFGPGLVLLNDSAFAVIMPMRGDPGTQAPGWFTQSAAPTKSRPVRRRSAANGMHAV